MNNEFNLKLPDVCKILGRSRRTVSRHIQNRNLHPQRIKSRQGTLEYRFSMNDLDQFKKDEKIFFGKLKKLSLYQRLNAIHSWFVGDDWKEKKVTIDNKEYTEKVKVDNPRVFISFPKHRIDEFEITIGEGKREENYHFKI